MTERERGPARAVHAKARGRRRAKDAGAVMFIVAMTLAVIATMGMYALNVAATEVKTAGFVREQTQVHYLSEFGVLGTAQEVAGPKAQLYTTAMKAFPDTNCISLYGIPAGSGSLPLSCRVVGSAEMVASWMPPVAPVIAPWVSNASETSRGSLGLPTTPDFYVELTDPNWRNPPSGYDTSQGLCFVEFTVASVGISQLTAGSFVSEGLETSRARIIGGPIQCSH
jgi:hypothetical protein